ncbi:MAG: GFA family protein [Colwelliaceae bacterium]|nr:GFA family protein [Colwelliaceae bacterium]
MCQKFHGAAFSTFVEVKVSDLHWLRGKELLKSFQAENKTVRKFCQNCGSSLIFESKYNRKASTIEIALAAFDTKVDAKPDAHIFTQSKVEWIEITDNISQHLAFRE